MSRKPEIQAPGAAARQGPVPSAVTARPVAARIRLARFAAGAGVALLLASCAQMPRPEPGSSAVPGSGYRDVERKVDGGNLDRRLDAPAGARELPALGLADRMMKEPLPGADVAEGRGYTFRTRGISVDQALALFARANGLNVIAEPGLEGTLSVDFENVPLERAFELMLGSLGYAWEIQDKVIRVRKHETRTFLLDYIRLQRTASTTGSVGIGGSGTGRAGPGGGGAAGGGSGSGGAGGSVSSNNDGQFWNDFESQMRSLLSKDGRMTISRLTGTVQVTDLVPRVREIEAFIRAIRAGMHRQVDVEVRIVEVSLRDDQALGLDWTRLPINRFGGFLTTNTAITDAGGGLTPPPNTISGVYRRAGFEAIITALSQQGDVRVVSQPRIRILNNQTAFVRVGTDETFFTRTVNRLIQPGGSVVDTINETPSTVTLGVLMSVTPQISSDGYTMLDISPTVTRLAGTVTSPRGDSNAPNLEVKQTHTLVRVRDGEIVLLGGLIQEESTDSTRALPLVGDLPLLGRAFKSTYQAARRKELVIFLIPSILPETY